MRKFLAVLLFLTFSGNISPLNGAMTDLDTAAFFQETMEYKKAIEVLEKALENKEQIEVKKSLGRLYYLSGRFNDAVNILNGLKDKDWQALLYLGLSYEGLEKEEQAVNSYLASAKLKENSIALFRLGKIYYNQKQYHKAQEFFLRIVSFDPSVRLAAYYLADCFLQTGLFEKAYTYFVKTNNFYPDNNGIKKKLELVKNKLGEEFFAKRQEAETKVRETVKLHPYKREEGVPYIRVGIAQELREFVFKAGGPFTLTDGKKVFNGNSDKTYAVILQNNKLAVREQDSNRNSEVFSGVLGLKAGTYPVYIFNITYGQGNYWHKQVDRVFRGDFEVIIYKDSFTLVNIISIEEYLYGVLSAEISCSAGLDALKAQAVAARTIAVKNMGRHKKELFDVCVDVHCQVYHGMSAETAATTEAVVCTRGEILVYDEKPVEALYHSNCGGCLRSDAFGKTDYFIKKFDLLEPSTELSPYREYRWITDSGQDSFSANEGSSFRWQRVYDAEDFSIVFGKNLESVARIIPSEKGDCFHYNKMEIVTPEEKTTISGDLKIRNYFDNLRSSAFKIELGLSSADKPRMLILWGAGFGHGAGMSQEGAMNMAKKGYNYRDILKHYYPGTELKKQY